MKATLRKWNGEIEVNLIAETKKETEQLHDLEDEDVHIVVMEAVPDGSRMIRGKFLLQKREVKP